MSLSDALAQLEYPCRYPFKFFCHADEAVVAEISAVIRRHKPEWQDSSITRRHSRRGRYVAVTAVILANSAGEIENIYRDLAAVDGILKSI